MLGKSAAASEVSESGYVGVVVKFAQSASVGRVSLLCGVRFVFCVLGEVWSVTGLGFLLGGFERCGVAWALGAVCFVGLRLSAAFVALFG